MHSDQNLEVDFYQLMDDKLFINHRNDGLGWDWGWADWQRDWMNATPNRYAYRCLPLTIANQTGWWVKNPVGFNATWDGGSAPTSVHFQFDNPESAWPQSINSQFGHGIITWNTPFLIRTKPIGSRLLICGPANYFRKYAQPLTALIESDWMTMSFTMNYKVVVPNQVVRFEVGEPLFQVIPLISNVCTDLENATVRFRKLHEAPDISREYLEWSNARSNFHQAKARNEIKADQWQKDYFQGRDIAGREAPTEHRTKVKPPEVLISSAASSLTQDHVSQPLLLDQDRSMSQIKQNRSRPRPRRQPDHWPKGVTATSERPATDQPSDGTALASCPVNQIRGGAPEPQEVVSTAQNGYSAQSMATMGDSMTGAVATQTRSDSSVAPANSTSARMYPQVDDEWRRWIAESITLECDAHAILQAMVNAGFDPNDSGREIELALSSPYVRGAEVLRNRLKKRDWLLSAYRKIGRLDPESELVPRRHKITRGQFLKEYYSTNRPVIITGMMDDWPALKKWNLDFFAHNFAQREVEVQFGRNAAEDYEIHKEKHLKKIRMGEFIDLIRNAGTTNDFYLTAANNSSNKAAMPELWDDIVQVPEYLDANGSHNGFFWMGPAGTVTPFHHDLTNNFMAQVIGRKKVKIVPSWDIPFMRNEVHVFCQVDGRVTPPQPQPDINQPQILECILNPGEILFLPIGCLHYVEGVDVSVTVSFTNFVFRNDFGANYTTYHRV